MGLYTTVVLVGLAILLAVAYVLLRKPKKPYHPSGDQLIYLAEALCEAAEVKFPDRGCGAIRKEWVMSLVESECNLYQTYYDAEKVSKSIDGYVEVAFEKQD